ncbi:MAG: serine hydrolase, partial [Gemmatimonadota bacterium]|nr:serine hydrolase [Gemmatimonadota bacterium]
MTFNYSSIRGDGAPRQTWASSPAALATPSVLASAMALSLLLSSAVARPGLAQDTVAGGSRANGAATGAAAVAAIRSPLDGFDAYVQKGMREWRVPGIAIAIVRNDSVVLSRGYGVRTTGKRDPVDDRTLFAIASDTKAFTGVLMAMLVDSGKVRWDDHVTSYLPGLQLADPYVTRELTVRDLLTHRAGLARADLLWTGGYGYDTDQLMHRLRYLHPSWGLRSHYGYNNLMYGAAGEVIARASGKPWTELLRDRVLQPLGMTCTNSTVTALPSQSDVASPHAIVDGKLTTVAYTNIDALPAAGAINSCAADMAQWVRFQLDSGRVGNRRLVSARNFRETHTPQLAIRIDSAYRVLNPATHMRSYAIGWVVSDYHGREMLSHAGNLSGMSAMVGLLPEERLGVVVLSNLEDQALRESLMYRVFDMYLGSAPKDWSAETLAEKRRADSVSAADDRALQAKRARNTHQSLPLERYAGSYSDSLYGPARVTVENGHLVFAMAPRQVGDMEHWHYDTFRTTWR